MLATFSCLMTSLKILTCVSTSGKSLLLASEENHVPKTPRHGKILLQLVAVVESLMEAELVDTVEAELATDIDTSFKLSTDLI